MACFHHRMAVCGLAAALGLAGPALAGHAGEFTQTWYADSDGDTYGDPFNQQQAVSDPGTLWVSNAADWDDANPSINPGNSTPPTNANLPTLSWQLEAAVGDQLTIIARSADPNDIGDSTAVILPEYPQAATFDRVLSGNTSTGTLSWSPTSGEAGVHPLSFRAVDDRGGETFGSLSVQVGGITSGATSGTVPAWYRDADRDGEGDPFNALWQTVMPADYVDNYLDPDDSTHLITSDNATDWPVSGNIDPTLALEIVIPHSQTFTFRVSATDADGHDTIVALDLFPSTATFDVTVNGVNSEGLFTWTPDASDVGQYALQFLAYDDQAGQTARTLTLTVVPEPATLALLAMGGAMMLVRRRPRIG